MSKGHFSPQLVKKVANLANIPIAQKESLSLATAFAETLGVIDQLQQADDKNVEPVHHTTGLKNILREDEIDEKRMFSQKEALANAKKTYQGYFVVPGILEHK